MLLGARAAAAQSAPPPPITFGRLTLTGYVQMDYRGSLEADRDGRTTPPADGVLLQRARVGVSGELGSRVTWLVMSDFASLGDASILRDAYLTIRVAPHLSVRLGQYSIPYSLERLTSPATLEVIERSVLGTSLTPSRDIGVTVFNPQPIHGWISYSASVIDGAGPNRSDDNAAKDVVGRLAVRLPQAPGLSIGVNGEAGDQPAGPRRRRGVDVSYERGPVRVAAEALAQVTTDAARRETSGYYLFGVWHHPAATPRRGYAGYELAARWVDVDDEAGALTTREVQVGGNYYLTPQVRVMHNLIVPVGDDQPRPRTRWWSRLQVVF